MPLVDVKGNVPGVASLQYGPNCTKVGVVGLLTVTVALPSVPQQPAADCALK
jgi:hypothetical protein